MGINRKFYANAIEGIEDLAQHFENEIERLTEAIEAAYQEGFEDARSDEDNEMNACWRASNAKKEQQA